MRGLVEELRRRKVFRVGAAYLVGAWAVAQVAEYAAGVFGAPGWVLKTLTVLLLLGLPLALVLAWAFDVTPDGVKRDGGGPADAPGSAPGGRKLAFAAMAVVAAIVIVLAAERFAGDEERAAPAALPATVAPPGALTLAVLPFTNMSSDRENEFFADGLTEELLNVLARIEGLLVAGRTSSFHFKDKNDDLRLIGNQLGVAHILEGSVRKSGDSVRITAQLIKAEDGFHLWSETYDRRLDDIFAIQDEIAAAVATALRARLLGAEDSVAAAQAEIDPEVYARFIAAKSRIAERGLDNLASAQESLEEIVLQAPDYAPAHAALAIAALTRWRTTRTIPIEQARAIARTSTARALELAPDDDYVQTAYGIYLSELVENATEAGLRRVNAVFQRAIELNPENVEAMHQLAFNLRYLEDYEEAIALLDRALRIDPLALPVRDLRSWALIDNGRMDEAIEFARRTADLFPQRYDFRFRAAHAEIVRGRPDRALAWAYDMQRARGEAAPFVNVQILTLARELDYAKGIADAAAALRAEGSAYAEMFEYLEAGAYGEALRTVRAAIERDGWAPWEYELFVTAIMAGRCEEAFESNFSGRLRREWSEGEPRVDNTNDNRAIWTAYCMRVWKRDEQADALLRATLEYARPRPGRYDEPGLRLERFYALVMLGEYEPALAEFQAYYDAGFGSMPTIPFDEDPRLGPVVAEPRFRETLAAIKARNSRRLDRMIEQDFAVDLPL